MLNDTQIEIKPELIISIGHAYWRASLSSNKDDLVEIRGRSIYFTKTDPGIAYETLLENGKQEFIKEFRNLLKQQKRKKNG